MCGLIDKCNNFFERKELPKNIILTDELLEEIVMTCQKYIIWGNKTFKVKDVIDILKGSILKDFYCSER